MMTKYRTVPLHESSCKSHFYLSVAQQPKSGLDGLILKFQYHRHMRYESPQRVISSSQTPLPAQHTIDTRDEHILPAVFETAVPAIEGPQTHALDRTAKGIGKVMFM